MKTSDFDYFLPSELIAQTPIEVRDQSRLMVVDRQDGSIKHRRFFEIVDCLRAGDIIVFNDSRVIPARLSGRKVDSGGKVELLLLRRLETGVWEALVKHSSRINTGALIEIGDGGEVRVPEAKVMGEVIGLREGGLRVLHFTNEERLAGIGEIPLPPYIRVPLACRERYQTVYATVAGSVAAPTAGLHFTPGLIDKLKGKGVQCLFITLHVGLDTFRPVREADPREHQIYREYGIISEEVANQLSEAKRAGRRVICVGTTTVRLLEAAAQTSNPLKLEHFAGWVNLFILPGHQFKMVDALITNFHLPKSTVLMLATAFAGKDLITTAYKEAIAQKYRFYSFGDAMLLL